MTGGSGGLRGPAAGVVRPSRFTSATEAGHPLGSAFGISTRPSLGSFMKKIDKGNLSMRVYAAIRGSLMNGEYRPGDRLRIGQLADEMEVSITPVREAMFRLVSEQALEMKAATAVHVPILSPETMTEIQLMRTHLEGACAAEAARRATTTEIARLERIHVAFAAAIVVDPLKAARENREFHFALHAAARMPLVISAISNLWAMMGPLIPIFHENIPRRELIGDNHKHVEVLRALRERDPEATRRAIQADIAWGNLMIGWLADQRQALQQSESVS